MTRVRDTQVAIIGAGTAGLLLAHLLDLCGVKSVVLEQRTRHSVETTVRAGVLEQSVVELLEACGLGERMRREGFVHHGINLRFNGETHRLDMHRLTVGRDITVYAQHEVLRDLIAASAAAGRDLRFEAQDVRLHELDGQRPRVTFRHGGEAQELRCDFVAGCDGFHGIARPTFPPNILRSYERQYQIGWLGILVNAPRYSDELIYARHDRGFALVSTRSPTVQRLYVQCDPNDPIEQWPDDRIWQELAARLETRDGWTLTRGEIFQKYIVSMRSFVAEPMRHGRLFLAGDAAHIVPPTGAKGLNLAVADVSVLAAGLAEFYAAGRTQLLDDYSAICLPRIWRAQRFSAWMTTTLHQLPGMDDFQRRVQLAELENVVRSPAAATNLAENYVGVPLPEAALAVPWGELAKKRGWRK
jgi:p-hydroxybenzoate 3-monooxygenase